MTPLERVLKKLPDAKQSGQGWSARCPAHDDRRPSLSVSEDESGRVLLHCHAGCEPSSVLEALSLKFGDLRPATPIRSTKRRKKIPFFSTANDAIKSLEKSLGKHTGRWSYHDINGRIVCEVVRWDTLDGTKEFRPVSFDGCVWKIQAMETPRPLYQLPTLAAADLVVVVEGEKAADAARRLGFTATTSMGGCKAVRKSDWTPLAGKKVWIFPDNDSSGKAYADTLAGILAKLNPVTTVRIVELPGLPEGGDVVDWVEARGDAAEPDWMRRDLEEIARSVHPLVLAEESVRPLVLAEELARPLVPAEEIENDFGQLAFPANELPEPIRSFVVAGAAAIGCDLSYVGLPALVAVAAAIGISRKLEIKRSWSVPPILWGVIVGESGTHKTPAFKLVMRPLRMFQQKAFEEHRRKMEEHAITLASWEKKMSAWKKDKHSSVEPPAKPAEPVARRYFVSDTTVEALAPLLMENQRGLLVSRDELNGWFASFDKYGGKGSAGADSSSWLSMFNAEPITVDRKTGVPKTIHVSQASVCIIGGIQPGILQRTLGSEHRESGLAARLLMTCPPRKQKQWTEADLDPRLEEAFASILVRLNQLEPVVDEHGDLTARLVRLDPEAKELWISYYGEHAAEHAVLTGDLSAAWSKLEEYTARIALVIHLTRWAAKDPLLKSEDLLNVQSMTSAITLVKWFKGEARKIYDMLDETDSERDERRLVEWIGQRAGRVTVRDVQQGCRWLKEPGRAEEAMTKLVNAGRGRWLTIEPGPQGGRPTKFFELTMVSTVNETPKSQIPPTVS